MEAGFPDGAVDEADGWRERDPKDRRRVIVHLNPGPALAEIGPTFGPLVRAWRGAAASYSDAELRLLLDFQGRFLDIVRDQLSRLRDEAAPSPGRQRPDM